jgi:hypothetical protein
MKRPALAAAFCLVVSSLVMTTSMGEAHATEVGGPRRFGLGFAIGEPTSLVGKYFLNPVNAIDFGLAFARLRRNCDPRPGPGYRCERFGYVSVNADYLWQDNLAREAFRLDWHIGAGGRLSVSDDYYYYYDEEVLIFARMPVGLDLTFAKPEFLEVFMEVAPALLLVPEIDLELEAFVGVRFYF